MGILNVIAIVFLILVVVVTSFTEPKLSMQYFSAAGKSGGVIFKKGTGVIGSWVKEHNEEVKEND